jgi:hypothetical protein
MQYHLECNIRVMRSQIGEGSPIDDPNYPPSLRVYISNALAEYECWIAYHDFWVSRAPDRIPPVIALADAISSMKKNDIVCPSFEKIRIPKPQFLLTLEDMQNRIQEVIN